ncbi:MAG: heparan-alpha-glucosaminide N-acetyltransferase domain-containing protein [Vicinamibacterales bacterium]
MQPGQRLLSLDVFRGLTMAAMVIVNNPGDWGNVYGPLLHAEWHGWTPTDLIFPFFLFIVGVSITLSKKSAGWGSILRRAVIIFGLGLFLSGYPRFDVERWRIPGVLQRIALCYLAAAAAYRVTTGNRRRQAAVIGTLAAILALGYWAVMMFVPPPGGVAGDLTPEGNLGAWIDRALLEGHLWKPRWDPEGLLSTVPAIATTLLGVLAGLCLTGTSPERASNSRVEGWTAERKAAALAAGGAVAVVVGLAWGLVFPINKPIWTSSYAVFTAGAASLLLAACYWILDIRGWRRWTTPLVILGVNAITLFLASGLLVKTLALIRVAGADGREIAVSRWAYLHGFAPFLAPKNASLLYAVANLVVLFALLSWMYRRRLFLRV